MLLNWGTSALAWEALPLVWGTTNFAHTPPPAPTTVVFHHRGRVYRGTYQDFLDAAAEEDEEEDDGLVVTITIDTEKHSGSYAAIVEIIKEYAAEEVKYIRKTEQTEAAVQHKMRSINRRFKKRLCVEHAKSDTDVDEDMLLEEIEEDLLSVYSDAVMATTERVH